MDYLIYGIRLLIKRPFLLLNLTVNVLSMLFSPQDTSMASRLDAGTVRIWNIATGQAELVLTAHHNVIDTLGFSGDDRWNEESFYAAGEGEMDHLRR